jgi:DNA (cytosine-5)-methyltransferase 1
MITFGSLFAGIGGFDLGFERAGMRCAWQVEKDPFCLKVLAKHWPDVERFDDVRNVGSHNLSPVDVICGGFPCQPHSVAGQRRGAADDRDLWPEYRRIIADLRPAYVVGENVPGIRTTILDAVLSDLENLNYATATFVIPACALDAPHRRDRVFIIAYAGNSRQRELFQSQQERRGEASPDVGRNGKVQSVSNATRHGRQQGQQNGNGSVEGIAPGEKYRFGNGGGVIPHTTGAGLEGADAAGAVRAGGWAMQRAERDGWQPEPGVGRVADGVPRRVDRLRSLGNAVVPQVAEFIGRLVREDFINQLQEQKR